MESKLDKETITELQYQTAKALFNNLGTGIGHEAPGAKYLKGYRRAAQVVAAVLRKAAQE